MRSKQDKLPLLDSPFHTRLRYAMIIVFRMGRKGLRGGRDNRKPA
jgi:hypothetical protein